MQIVHDNDVYTDIIRILNDYRRENDRNDYANLLLELSEEMYLRLELLDSEDCENDG